MFRGETNNRGFVLGFHTLKARRSHFFSAIIVSDLPGVKIKPSPLNFDVKPFRKDFPSCMWSLLVHRQSECCFGFVDFLTLIFTGLVVNPSDQVLDDDTIRLDGLIVFISGLRVRIILDHSGHWEPERYRARGAKAVVVTGVSPGTGTLELARVTGNSKDLHVFYRLDGGALSFHVPHPSLCRSILPMLVYGTSYEAGQNMSALIAKYGNVTARFPPTGSLAFRFRSRFLPVKFSNTGYHL
jgi:hypothetical protein